MELLDGYTLKMRLMSTLSLQCLLYPYLHHKRHVSITRIPRNNKTSIVENPVEISWFCNEKMYVHCASASWPQAPILMWKESQAIMLVSKLRLIAHQMRYVYSRVRFTAAVSCSWIWCRLIYSILVINHLSAWMNVWRRISLFGWSRECIYVLKMLMVLMLVSGSTYFAHRIEKCA